MNPNAPTLRAVTLGCKVNQYETEYLRQGLERLGWRDALPQETADLCVVNTCTVTHEGDAKSRQTIRQLAERNPGTRLVVMGCYATRAPEEVAALPGVVEVITDKRELPDLLARWGLAEIPTGISRFANRQRAFVKVQDGCLLRCSFCIIPQVRPHMESRPVEAIEEEVRRLVEHGHHEIVLTGIHLGHYGVDRLRGQPRAAWQRLAQLVERLARLPGEFRLRLSSIEATEVTRELIDVLADHGERICPHLHVCLQSGSDTVLRRMGRRWGSRRIEDRCRLLQDRLDLPALTTDVIVGFPGETSADFDETLRVCESIGFAQIHIFPYSPRRGTRAATWSDQVAPSEKQARVAQLERLGRELQARYGERLVGRELGVIVEPTRPTEAGRDGAAEVVRGTSCRYLPVEMPAAGRRVGSLERVRIVASRDGLLVGG